MSVVDISIYCHLYDRSDSKHFPTIICLQLCMRILNDGRNSCSSFSTEMIGQVRPWTILQFSTCLMVDNFPIHGDYFITSFIITIIPLKTNISPENSCLEDDSFPLKNTVPDFRVNFRSFFPGWYIFPLKIRGLLGDALQHQRSLGHGHTGRAGEPLRVAD